MKNFSRKQIIALNKLQMQSVSTRQEEPTHIEQKIQVQNNKERSDDGKNETETEMKQEPKGKINFRKTSIVDDSIKELTSAIKLLSNNMPESHSKLTNVVELLSKEIKMISDKQNQQRTPAKSLQDQNNMTQEKSNRIQERFQPVNVQIPNDLIKYLKQHQCEQNQKSLEKLEKQQENEAEQREREQKKKENEEKRRERNRMINNWLGVVCSKVFSIGFLLYKKDQLKLKEVKAFCSENMIRNILNLSKQGQLNKDDFRNIDSCLANDLLPYFKSKYPQTTESEVNMALSKQIVPIDNMESNQYDLIHKSGVKFEQWEDGNYNQDIMKLANYVFQVPQSFIDIDQKKGQENVSRKNDKENSKGADFKQGEESKIQKNLFDCYEEKMNNYMELICKRPQDLKIKDNVKQLETLIKQEQKPKLTTNNENLCDGQEKKVSDPEEKQKIKDYEIKVRSYSNFEIGQKLSKNLQNYSKSEMQEQTFKCRNSAHIRVLTKWCEQLYKNFDEDYIIQRQIPFHMKDGNQGYLNNNNLKLLWSLLQYQKQQIQERLNEINQNNHQLQSKFSKMNLNQNLQIFLKNEAIIGQFSTIIYKNYENYLINYLNILIHSINKLINYFILILKYNKICYYSQEIKIQEIIMKSKRNSQNQ